MNLKISLLLVGLACFAHTGNAHDADHSTHHALKSGPSQLSGKSVYNLTSKWKTTDNKSVELSMLQGKPQLITMLFTSCSTACPMLVDKMKGVSKSLAGEEKSKLKMTIVSFDPARDTPQALSKFAVKHSLDLTNWTLLSPTSEADSNELAGVLGIQYKKIKDDYVHSNVIFLLDAKGELVASDEGLSRARPEFIAQVKKLTQPK